MKTRILLVPALFASAFALEGCARNYAVEGAAVGAAVGAGVGAATGEDVGTAAAVGAAAGAVGGTLIRKDRDWCYYRDRHGREYRERC